MIPMVQTGGYRGDDNPDTVVVRFDVTSFPSNSTISSIFGTGVNSYHARNITRQWVVAHEIAGRAEEYVGPASEWKVPRTHDEDAASELRAECAVSQVTGKPLRAGVSCP